MVDLTPAQEDYFRTLAKIDPSSDMARVIEQAKSDLTRRRDHCWEPVQSTLRACENCGLSAREAGQDCVVPSG